MSKVDINKEDELFKINPTIFVVLRESLNNKVYTFTIFKIINKRLLMCLYDDYLYSQKLANEMVNHGVKCCANLKEVNEYFNKIS